MSFQPPYSRRSATVRSSTHAPAGSYLHPSSVAPTVPTHVASVFSQPTSSSSYAGPPSGPAVYEPAPTPTDPQSNRVPTLAAPVAGSRHPAYNPPAFSHFVPEPVRESIYSAPPAVYEPAPPTRYEHPIPPTVYQPAISTQPVPSDRASRYTPAPHPSPHPSVLGPAVYEPAPPPQAQYPAASSHSQLATYTPPAQLSGPGNPSVGMEMPSAYAQVFGHEPPQGPDPYAEQPSYLPADYAEDPPAMMESHRIDEEKELLDHLPKDFDDGMPDVDVDLLRSRLQSPPPQFDRLFTSSPALHEAGRFSPPPFTTAINMEAAEPAGVHWNPSAYSGSGYDAPSYAQPSSYADEEKDYLGLYASHPYTDEGDSQAPNSQAPDSLLGSGASPLLRRALTHKSVRLTRGHLVIDCPVPSRMLDLVPRHTTEFTRMRYTAVTCDPKHFVEQNYTLRSALMRRPTELFICLTLYNEDEVLFTRTLHGVMKNIMHLCSLNRSIVWGPDGWKKVVVAIVADGRADVHPRVLDCLAAMGVYQDGIAQGAVDDHPVQAHLFEYSTQLSLNPKLRFRGAERGVVPIQILFCLKERNLKKINSHRWFFEAFCPTLNPNVCVLVDAGTRPEPKSIYHLWKAFDKNPRVGGACGEICADPKGKWGLGWSLLNPIVAAQNFEYKISNILDKTTESLFGFVSVLPGAFSAYRYQALLNDEYGRGPLGSYFRGETPLGNDPDVFTSNMYLAEDRILCFELVAKAHAAWTLQYVKSARAWTDVPSGLAEFISQRRRWLNGSLFAGMYALIHVGQMCRSGHSFVRKFWLLVLDTYHILDLIVSWLSVANFYLFFRIITTSLEDPKVNLHGIAVWNTITKYVYIAALGLVFVCSLGNRPKSAKWKYTTASVIFSILTAYMLAAAIFCFVRASLNITTTNLYGQMLAAMVLTWGVYIVSSILALDPLHLLTSFVQYLVMSSTYANILQVYAFCNLHDLSWGTKEESRPPTDLGRAKTVRAKVSKDKPSAQVDLPSTQRDVDTLYDEAIHKLQTNPPVPLPPPDPIQLRLDLYKNIRTDMLFCWILSNGALVAFVFGDDTGAGKNGGSRPNIYMIVVLSYVGITSAIRFLGSTIYMLLYILRVNQ